MKNLTGNSSEDLKISEKNRNINKNKKKGINKSGSTRQKSSNIFKQYKEDNIKIGDKVVTSGLLDKTPQGILIGIVKKLFGFF